MTVEVHITLKLPPHAEPALRGWLDANALRLTYIELSQGASPRQTMITTWLPGDLDDARARARAIGARLGPLGISVTRTKIEVEDTPEAALVPALYVEHHVKVRTRPEQLTALSPLCTAHGAHLSRNPLRAGEDGAEERFLTQRFPAHAPLAAATGLGALLRALRVGTVPVLRVTRERVLHDDNLSLDAGWHTEVSR